MKNVSVKILDCTLRDGGYINDFEFGFENIKNIVSNLIDANVDFIECGFLKTGKDYKKNSTIYNNIFEFLNLVKIENKELNKSTNYCLMINFGDVDIQKIEKNKFDNLFLRISFKKHESNKALEFCEQLKNKNYKIFVSPMHTSSYDENEIKNLIQKTNDFSPFAFSIVDTTGSMDKTSVDKMFDIIDKNLNPKISLCFHSHNNLELSYENAINLINKNSNRNLIIDCSLLGMGRGAGNLKNEEICAYYNKIFSENKYNINLIQKTIQDYILPIYQKTPWSASEPYKLSAKNNIHPNYTKFLIEKGIKVDKIKKIFKIFPEEKKRNFDKNFIETLKI